LVGLFVLREPAASEMESETDGAGEALQALAE
jgi:hypothetical protein